MTEAQRASLIDIHRDQYIDHHIRDLTRALPPPRRRAVGQLVREFTNCVPYKLNEVQRTQLLYAVLTQSITYRLTDTGQTQYSYLQPLLKSTGVCQGISELFLILAQPLGLEARIVVGVAGSEDCLHAWNMVRLPLNGASHWYHLDATWDLEHTRWRYFLKGDAYMNANRHEWLAGIYPAAPCDAPPLPPLNDMGIQKLIAYLDKLRQEIKQ